MRIAAKPGLGFLIALVLLTLAPGLAMSAAPGGSTSEKPNIVYILVDNWGWGYIGIQGGATPTPRIDAFAAEGLRMTNFNVQNQCTPTRSAIHTGRLPIRSGTQKVAAPGEPQGLSPWEYTLAELLSDSGYATALYGKWHLGNQRGRLPTDQGYDEWYGIRESAMEASYTATPQFDPEVFEAPQVWQGVRGSESTPVKPFDLEARAVLDAEVVAKTVAFIRRQAKAGAPFYVLAAFSQIHPPYLPHPDFAGRSGAGNYPDIRMQLDGDVGRILDALDAAGVADNTLVILTGDNAAGGPSPEWPGDGGSNKPWRGGLSTGYEGGLRTPGMVRWPGRVPSGRVSDEIFSDLDWYPTLANFVGAKARIPADRPVDGVDQSAFVSGKQEKSNREYVVNYVGNRVFSVKWRTLKVHFYTAEGTFSPIVEHTFPQVYDIENDPGESRELWAADGFAHLWVTKPVMEILGRIGASMRAFPNLKPGQDFEGYE